MTIKEEDLAKIVKLSRIALKDDEKKDILSDLDKIVDFVNRLKEVNVDEVTPMSYAIPHQMEWRADEVSDMIGREGLMGSVGYEDGLVRVPRIIE